MLLRSFFSMHLAYIIALNEKYLLFSNYNCAEYKIVFEYKIEIIICILINRMFQIVKQSNCEVNKPHFYIGKMHMENAIVLFLLHLKLNLLELPF